MRDPDTQNGALAQRPAPPHMTATRQDADRPKGSPEVPAQVRRRRAAALRCVPLADGRRDPLDPLPGSAELSVVELRGWCLAEDHLRAAGLAPVLPEAVARVLHQRRAEPSLSRSSGGRPR